MCKGEIAMKKKFVRFCIPTLFQRQELILDVFSNLIRQCELSEIDYEIDIIANQNYDIVKLIDFEEHSDKVNIMNNPVEFCIGKSLNMSLSKLKPNQHFCFFHDDMYILDEKWIHRCINISDDVDLNTGVIGLRLHSTGAYYCIDSNEHYNWLLDKVLWSDGFMWFSYNVYKHVGLFDERYKGDRESQAYCYNSMKVGFNNYAVLNRPTRQWNHIGTPYEKKTKLNSEKLLQLQKQSEELFFSEWKSWEDDQVRKQNR